MRIPIIFNRGGRPDYTETDENGLLIAVTGDHCHVVDKAGRITQMYLYNVRVKMGQSFSKSITAAVKP